ISKEYTDPSIADIVTTTSVDRLSHRDTPSSVVEVVVVDKKGEKITHRLDSRLLIRSVRARKTADYKHHNRSTQRFLEALRQVMASTGFVSASLIPVV
ncbi:MAG TPA: hypothetical protein PLH12_08355, partial [Pseudomonadales bacterium]|nr:hypothetical protein [Pseudomonadales bacterium]